MDLIDSQSCSTSLLTTSVNFRKRLIKNLMSFAFHFKKMIQEEGQKRKRKKKTFYIYEVYIKTLYTFGV